MANVIAALVGPAAVCAELPLGKAVSAVGIYTNGQVFEPCDGPSDHFRLAKESFWNMTEHTEHDGYV